MGVSPVAGHRNIHLSEAAGRSRQEHLATLCNASVEGMEEVQGQGKVCRGRVCGSKGIADQLQAAVLLLCQGICQLQLGSGSNRESCLVPAHGVKG